MRNFLSRDCNLNMLTDDEELLNEIAKTQIVAPVGGKGSRAIPMQVVSLLRKEYGEEIVNKLHMPKHLFEVAGKPLIQWFIELFKKNGFKEFVFLVGNGGEAIEAFIGDGSCFGIKVRYSEDPPLDSIGKGKAFLNALLNGAIDKNKRAIVAFPDDFIFYQYAPLELLAKHIHYRKRDPNILATVLLSPFIKSPYGIADVEGIKVVNFKEKPRVKLFANTGIVVLEPEAYAYIEKYVDLNAKNSVELEDTVYPVLAKEGRMAHTFLPSEDDWVSVNSLKDLINLEKELKEKFKYYL